MGKDKGGNGEIMSEDQLAEQGIIGSPSKNDASGSASSADKAAAADKAGKDFDKQYDQSKKDKR